MSEDARDEPAAVIAPDTWAHYDERRHDLDS